MFLLCFYRMTSRQKANTSCYISMLLRSQPFLTNCVEALPQTLMPQFSQRTFHVLLLFQSLVHISISLIRELSPYSTSKYNQEERNMSDMSNSKLETTFFPHDLVSQKYCSQGPSKAIRVQTKAEFRTPILSVYQLSLELMHNDNE